jgi:hypothetical protein
MVENMLVIIKTIKNMVTEFLNGMMEEDMKAIGITVNNTEKVYTLM